MFCIKHNIGFTSAKGKLKMCTLQRQDRALRLLANMTRNMFSQETNLLNLCVRYIEFMDIEVTPLCRDLTEL
jgi:hypothetical protein